MHSYTLTPKIQLSPTEIRDTGRIIAIGDIHGDIKSLNNCLRIAGVVNKDGSWTGKNTVVVQVGDLFDRGNDELEILQLVHKLNREATENGGAVVSLVGNHEVMAMVANHKHATVGAFKSFTRLKPQLDEWLKGDWSHFMHLPELQRCRAAAMYPGGILSHLMARHPVVLKVGETVFCHGGLSTWHLQQHTMEEMNYLYSIWALGMGPLPTFLQGAPGSDTVVWNRAYSMPESKDITNTKAREELSRTLAMVGANRMVVGHTVQKSEGKINSACEGKVWRIDTGLAEFYGGCPEVLEIRGTEVSVLTNHKTVPGIQRSSSGPIQAVMNPVEISRA